MTRCGALLLHMFQFVELSTNTQANSRPGNHIAARGHLEHNDTRSVVILDQLSAQLWLYLCIPVRTNIVVMIMA